jgi:hypothetical protein
MVPPYNSSNPIIKEKINFKLFDELFDLLSKEEFPILFLADGVHFENFRISSCEMFEVAEIMVRTVFLTSSEL